MQRMSPSVTKIAISRLTRLISVVALVVMGTGPALAQGQFEPVIRVNDKSITAYELEQRLLLLQALGAPGNLAEEARQRLIDERLQVQAADALGLTATEEGLQEGVAEFAARTNTDADNFLATLAARGVAPESFVDFVEAGLLWREVIRIRFAPRAQISEDDVDRAVALAGQQGGARVLLSEIILPARSPEELAAAEARAAEVVQINGFEAFSAAARNISASSSRPRGGRIDWLPLNNLPPPLRAQLLTLPPGGITEPLRLPNAIAIFQLRALEELPPEQSEVVAVDYARFLIPGGDAGDAARVAARLDTCDDLYGVAQGLPEELLTRDVLPPSDVPADIARELETMDDNEVSTRLTSGNARVVLMLCGRSNAVSAELDRSEIRRQLLNQRLAGFAEAYLAELRADAVIVELE